MSSLPPVNVPPSLASRLDDTALQALLSSTRSAVATNAVVLHKLCQSFETLAADVAAAEQRTRQRLDAVVDRVQRAVERAEQALDEARRLSESCVSKEEFNRMNAAWEARLRRLEHATSDILPQNQGEETDKTSDLKKKPPLGPLGTFVMGCIDDRTRQPMAELYDRISSEWDSAYTALSDETIRETGELRSAVRLADRDALRAVEDARRDAIDLARQVQMQAAQALKATASLLAQQHSDALGAFGFLMRREVASQLHHTRGQNQALCKSMAKLRSTLCLPPDEELMRCQQAPTHTAATDFLLQQPRQQQQQQQTAGNANDDSPSWTTQKQHHDHARVASPVVDVARHLVAANAPPHTSSLLSSTSSGSPAAAATSSASPSNAKDKRREKRGQKQKQGEEEHQQQQQQEEEFGAKQTHGSDFSAAARESSSSDEADDPFAGSMLRPYLRSTAPAALHPAAAAAGAGSRSNPSSSPSGLSHPASAAALVAVAMPPPPPPPPLERRGSVAADLFASATDLDDGDIRSILGTPIFVALRDMLLDAVKGELDAKEGMRDHRYRAELGDLATQMKSMVSLDVVHRLIERGRTQDLSTVSYLSSAVKELQASVASLRELDYRSMLQGKADFSVVDAVRVQSAKRIQQLEDAVTRLERALVISMGESLGVAPRDTFAKLEERRVQDEADRERLALERGGIADGIDIIARKQHATPTPPARRTATTPVPQLQGGDGSSPQSAADATAASASAAASSSSIPVARAAPFGLVQDARSVVVTSPRALLLHSAPPSRPTPMSDLNQHPTQQRERVSSAGSARTIHAGSRLFARALEQQQQQRAHSPLSEDGSTSIIFSAYSQPSTTASQRTQAAIGIAPSPTSSKQQQQQQQHRPPRHASLVYMGAASTSPVARPASATIGTAASLTQIQRPQRPATAGGNVAVQQDKEAFVAALQSRCGISEKDARAF